MAMYTQCLNDTYWTCCFSIFGYLPEPAPAELLNSPVPWLVAGSPPSACWFPHGFVLKPVDRLDVVIQHTVGILWQYPSPFEVDIWIRLLYKAGVRQGTLASLMHVHNFNSPWASLVNFFTASNSAFTSANCVRLRSRPSDSFLFWSFEACR